jgi:hypothetical protein
MRRLIRTAALLLSTLVAVPACAVEPHHRYGGYAPAPAWHHRPAPAPWGWHRPWRPAPAWHAGHDWRPRHDGHRRHDWRPPHDRAWRHDGDGGRHAWRGGPDRGRRDRW